MTRPNFADRRTEERKLLSATIRRGKRYSIQEKINKYNEHICNPPRPPRISQSTR